MKPLPASFEFSGFKYRQVHREGSVAVYEQSKGERIAFEVVQIREQRGGKHHVGGRDVIFEDKERYPSSEEWGIYGFTYTDQDSALEKARNLHTKLSNNPHA